ncbi:MAG: hypothetical protein OK422_01595 [Thaumarchaeota archaeon]|nr:hypothetical protein [Nitrososphaerota archaeon]
MAKGRIAIAVYSCLVLLLFISTATTPSFSAMSAVATQAGTDPSGYLLTRLSQTSYDNCFLPAPSAASPLFGNPRAWGLETTWGACKSGYLNSSSGLSYSFLNTVTGEIQAGRMTNSGLPKVFTPAVRETALGEASTPFSLPFIWSYRGEVVVPSSSGSLNTIGTFLYAFDTTTGTSLKIPIPTSNPSTDPKLAVGATNFVCAVNDPSLCITSLITISGSHPTKSGSSALVGLTHTVRVAAQNITDTNGAVVFTIPEQLSTDLAKLSNLEWHQYSPVTGPSPSDHVVKTLTCPPTAAAPQGTTFDVLEQDAAPTQVASGGYAGFAYVRVSSNVSESNLCGINPNPPYLVSISSYPTGVELVINDLNVANVAHVVKAFAPPQDPAQPQGFATCVDVPPCFHNLVGMWGNLAVYSTTNSTTGTDDYWLLDALHGTTYSLGKSVWSLLSPLTETGKFTDGSSAIWYNHVAPQGQSTNGVFLLNGHVGVQLKLTGDNGATSGPPHGLWVDGRWAAWANQSNFINFYDVYNATVAYLAHPRIYSVKVPGELPGSLSVQNGTATWISLDANAQTGCSACLPRLNWYNATLAFEGKPASGRVDLSALAGTAGAGQNLRDNIATNGWMFLDVKPSGENFYQIFAVKIPTSVFATSTSGQILPLLMSGNITSSQVLKATFEPSPAGVTTTVSLLLTGKPGTQGTSAITIPKSAVPAGLVPRVSVNGTLAQKQSFSQDFDNFYVTFAVHFSVENVEIVFVQTGATSSTSSLTQSSKTTTSTTTSTTSSSRTTTSSAGSTTSSTTTTSSFTGGSLQTILLVAVVVVVVALVGIGVVLSRRSKKIFVKQ